MFLFVDAPFLSAAAGRELARYELDEGERVLFGARVEGGTALADVPVSAFEDRQYTVDTCWRNAWTLPSFVDLYVEVAERLGRCPMEPDLEAKAWDLASTDEGLAELYWRIARS